MKPKLSYHMHIGLMGTGFLSFKSRSPVIHSRTIEALIRRGLMDENYNRTALGMEYVHDQCDRLNRLWKASDPTVPLIFDDQSLLEEYRNYPEVSVYVYGGNIPLVVSKGNGQDPLGILCARYLWGIQVGKFTGKFLKYRPVVSRKGSYSYDFINAR